MDYYSQKQFKVIELMAKNETQVSLLYQSFAQKYPGYRDFWIHLSEDEKNHADWLTGLFIDNQTGKLLIKENRFRISPIVGFSDFLKSIRQEINKENFDLISAFSISSSIEDALIEREFFEIIDTDSPRLQHVLLKIKKETEKHRQIVRDMLDRQRQKLNI